MSVFDWNGSALVYKLVLLQEAHSDEEEEADEEEEELLQ